MVTEQHFINENEAIPNNPDLPLVIYREAFNGQLKYDIKETFAKNGWSGAWTNGVFTYHHYHSVSHEVLAVIEGSATLIFGGPEGKEVKVQKGDIIIIPAGVGHLIKEHRMILKLWVRIRKARRIMIYVLKKMM